MDRKSLSWTMTIFRQWYSLTLILVPLDSLKASWRERERETNYQSFSAIAAEAEAKYGKDKLKIYTSKATSLYNALTERKPKVNMKLICLLPEEKVGKYNAQTSPLI